LRSITPNEILQVFQYGEASRLIQSSTNRGGFGPLTNTFGLGTDQIIGARIVTADGVEKEVDDELLWAIKGTGGAFGVLTEVTLKTYPLPKILGGMVIFNLDEAPTIITKFQELVNSGTLPSTLAIAFRLGKKSGQGTLTLMFSWSSGDFEEGRKWLDKVKSCGTVMMDMVSESKRCDIKKSRGAMMLIRRFYQSASKSGVISWPPTYHRQLTTIRNRC